MSIASKVKQKIKRMPKGSIITLNNFSAFPNKRAVALCLSRLKCKGEIERLGKGKYYVSEKTKFGAVGPSETSVIKTLLNEDKNSYITGLAAYNGLGLTTQVPSEITIVGNRYNRKIRIGNVRIKYIKRKTGSFLKKNVFILQLLDAISDIKKIPDTPTSEAVKILKRKIQDLSLAEKKIMIEQSRYYRPFVRALLGEIMDEFNINDVEKIRSTINPLSVFKIGVSSKILPLKKRWNLI